MTTTCNRFIEEGSVFLIVILVLTAGLQAGPAFGDEAAPAGLKPCPSSPNCVSSSAQDPGHRIAPFALSGTPAETLTLLAKAIVTFPRATIKQQGNLYLKAEFRTRLRFIDDVEFLVDEAEGLVQVRSASRMGYWDIGVNRRRMEALRRVCSEMVKKKEAAKQDTEEKRSRSWEECGVVYSPPSARPGSPSMTIPK